MIYTTESRNFVLTPGVNCRIELPVPDLVADSNQAPGLGDSYPEKEENLDRFLSEIFFPQYTRSLKEAHLSYLRTDLPEKFLRGANVLVASLPGYAFYDYNDDIIAINADTLVAGCRIASGESIYGHEIGHRIVIKKNQSESESAISETAEILMISDRELALEFLCDAFGELINSRSKSIFCELFGKKSEGLQNIALKLAWSC